ncbi:electron transport complex subunit RsxA [Vibrio agarivorans]|uniref:Ion-translocating oxidoreductase complex subunit A n=1 Tax=Vibrio agarivorans TaxID=153622 RepID=A0ABT7XZK9_9VIBR|nr:electron transport complex subunit RsxA [Vibrio agarivorans]MDN2481222.1 electron transport complex subunit RsxA [Vibrio agarivorans]MDN3663404.1 electron transport complex subunit RsxA [Vibrio agarivorans]
MDSWLVFLGAAFVNNVVLAKFLGLCPFMGVSKNIASALGMGLATTFVITVAAIASWVIERYVLVPLGIEVLRTIAFIVVIASVVQFTELYVQKNSPSMYQALGVFLPLITTNCAVLGVSLLVVQQKMSLLTSILFSLGSSLGFTLVIVLFAGIRSQLSLSKVPESIQGNPIAFITAGVLSMAFMGFSGMA